MKKTSKFLALALCAATVFSAVACGGGGGGFDMDETEADITSITILSSDWTAYDRDGRRNNTPVYQALKEAVGFDVKGESVAAASLSSTIATRRLTESLPEMFRIYGPYEAKTYQSLIEEGDVVAITDYVNESTKDQYPNLYEYMKQFEYMKSNVTYANGKIYFVPTYWSNEKCFWVRMDWIENLNNKLDEILVAEGVVSSVSQVTDALREKHKYVLPTTLTEFYRLARAFTIHDPDGNGSDDTKGYVTEQNRDMDSWMYVACDTGYKQWVQDKDPQTGAIVNEGTYVYASTTEGSKIATSIFNKMYSEKYISESSISNSEGAKKNAFLKGEAGMMYAHVERYNDYIRDMVDAIGNQLAGTTKAEKFQTAKAKIELLAPPAGKNGTYGGHSPYSSCFLPGPAINAKMSEARIKACLKLLEYYYSPEGQALFTYGIEGINYEKQADGSIKNLNKADVYGIVNRLTSYDYASRLSYVMELPQETLSIVTNGDKIANMLQISRESQCLSDYLDVVTPTAQLWITSAQSAFDQESTEMIGDKTYATSWKYDEKTWSDNGWNLLYSVSDKLNTKWSAFTYSYNNAFYGSAMQDEYNAFIASGQAQKRPGL